jgi:hypothetical protein
MTNKPITEYTEKEFLKLVTIICIAGGETEEEDIQNLLEFDRLTEHPAGSDLIFYPEVGHDHSPEGIVKEVKEWRAANGKPGFLPE